MKIAIAMSGGVDSSVAALLLRRQGHEVFGLTMDLGLPEGGGSRACSGPEATRAAEAVASELGIDLEVVRLGEVFEREVVSRFVEEYARGRTPNPCVRCNEVIKFGALLDHALALGAEAMATGHHARVLTDDSGGRVLARSADNEKDQSYFLYRLKATQVSRVLFPVGQVAKSEVRRLAREARLVSAERPESQDVCFLSESGIEGLLSERAPRACTPGPILDARGNTLGLHEGIGRYTVGQRRGLGLQGPRPRYVLAVDASRNAVIVGDGPELLSTALDADDLSWVGAAPGEEFRAQAAVRSTAAPAPCSVRVEGERLRVTFEQPQRAVCPGQAVVFYDGDVVLGGATIIGSVAGEEVQ